MNRENSIDFITSTLAPGEPETFELGGDYFELVSAVDPVDVQLTTRTGALRGSLRQISQTDHIKATEYDRITIVSATAQTIKFAYGTGEFGSRRAAGSVSILNSVTLDAATLAALETIGLDAATLARLSPYHDYGATYQSITNSAANVAEQIVAPGANVNGIIVWQGSLKSGGTTTVPLAAFLAKALAPATVIDGDTIIGCGVTSSTNVTGGYTVGHLQRPVRIPAGKGLYYISALAETHAHRFLQYTIL